MQYGGGECVTSATFKVLNSSSCTTAFLLDSDTDYKSRFKPLVGKGVELDRCEFRIYHIGKEDMVPLRYLCMYLTYQEKTGKKQEGVFLFIYFVNTLSSELLKNAVTFIVLATSAW